eukprot:4429331-Pyramimonas_sp.AAC.1
MFQSTSGAFLLQGSSGCSFFVLPPPGAGGNLVNLPPTPSYSGGPCQETPCWPPGCPGLRWKKRDAPT